MYRFNHLMVGLTVGSQDKAKIRYASLVSSLVESKKITFVHVGNSADMSPDIYKQKMRELVALYFKGPSDVNLEYHFVENTPRVIEEMLQIFVDMDVDLIIVGKISGEFTGSETIPVKLTRKAQCSVLFVPEDARPSRTRPKETNILVPVDFSENSADAMHMAIDFAVAHQIPTIYSIHVYDVPLGYYKRGKSFEEFEIIMRKNAKEKFKEFIEDFDFKGCEIKSYFKQEKKPYRAIEEIVGKNMIDLIVIGARGRKVAARLLLESVTEQLIRKTTVPLLAVKRKNRGMGILGAISEL